MLKNAAKLVCKLSSAIPVHTVCSLLQLPVHLNGAASLDTN